MQKFLLLLLAGALWAVTGCTQLPAQVNGTNGRGDAGSAGTGSDAAAPRARGELSPEGNLVFELLIAEFAQQRGYFGLAAEKFLFVARQTGDPRIAKSATHAAVYGGDLSRALEAARLWVELDPEDLEGHQSLAVLLLRDGQVGEATAHFERLLDGSHEENAQGFLIVTGLLSRERDKQRALDVMRELVKSRQDNPEALYAYAHMASLAGQYEEALRTLENLSAVEPKMAKAMVLKANILANQGHKEQALAVIGEALSIEPENYNLRLSYARMLVEEQQLDEARQQFELLNRQLPDNPDVVYALGLLALEAGEFDEGERYLHQLLDMGERQDDAAFSLGQTAEVRGKTEEAIRWYSAVSGGERFLDARLRVAVIKARAGRVDEALDDLRELELDTPEDKVRTYLAEGEILLAAERPADALQVYDQALEQFPGDMELLYARAMAAERVDRLDILEQDLRTILAHDPDNTQALNALGYTLADRTDRYDEAFELISRAYEKSPGDPAIIDSMGWVLYRMGRHEEAVKYLRQALDKQGDGEIAAHLGEVLWVMGRKEEARRVWSGALETLPDHKTLRQVIERFTQ